MKASSFLGVARGSAGIAALLITLPWSTQAYAVNVEFPFAHTSMIASLDGSVRLLLDPGDLSLFDGELVTGAFLDISLPGLIPAADVEVFVSALDMNWVGRNPTWTLPWTTPGGDLDMTYGHTMTLTRGRPANRLVIDVTHIVREMADRQEPKNGFLLTTSIPGRSGFNAAEVAVLGEAVQGVLRVTYKKISALGYTDGSRSFINR